jgi:uncharacterized membrane protein YtjA (UPF0391 family)
MYFVVGLFGLHGGGTGISHVVVSMGVRCFVVLLFGGHHWL